MSIILRNSEHGREDFVLDAFVELADSLVDDYDPLDFLYRLLDHAIPLTRADAGTVLLHYQGSLHVVASSDENAETVGVLTVQTQDGPAHQAFTNGEITHSPNLSDAATQWPAFAREISSFGWSASYAVPLRVRDRVVGSYVLFWTEGEKEGPTPQDQRMLRAFADVASIAVIQQRETVEVQNANLQLHLALESRIKVEQAKGMMAMARNCSLGEAFDLIRRYARSKGKRVTDVSRGVISGDLDIQAMSADVFNSGPKLAEAPAGAPEEQVA